MKNNLDQDLDFVLKHYEENKFDTGDAISKFHAKTGTTHRILIGRRWWAAAAAVFAAAFVLFAGGYGIYSLVQKGQVPVAQTSESHTAPHIFVFDNTPLADVLEELSGYYGRKLTAPASDKCLSATFPEDSLGVIVAAIETALEIDITIE